MKWQMKWKTLLFFISAAILIYFLTKAVAGDQKVIKQDPISAPRLQLKNDLTEVDYDYEAGPQPAQPETDVEPKWMYKRDTPEMDQLTCPKAVQATVGENVTLDFHLKSPQDVRRELIEWKFNNSIDVLVYRSQGVSKDQADQFKNRASLESIEDISKGKVAVKISSITKMDAGTYSCSVGRGQARRSCSIQLTTVERAEHVKAAALNRSGTTCALVLAASTLLYLQYD